jgi:hypothetical protein
MSLLSTNSELLLEAGNDGCFISAWGKDLIQPWLLWGAGPECLENWGKPWEGSRQLVCEPQFSLGTKGIQTLRYAAVQTRRDVPNPILHGFGCDSNELVIREAAHWSCALIFDVRKVKRNKSHFNLCWFSAIFSLPFSWFPIIFYSKQQQSEIRYSEQQSYNPILQTTNRPIIRTPNNNSRPITRYFKQEQWQSGETEFWFRDLLAWTGDVPSLQPQHWKCECLNGACVMSLTEGQNEKLCDGWSMWHVRGGRVADTGVWWEHLKEREYLES